MKKIDMTKEQKLVYDAIESIYGHYIVKRDDDGENVIIEVLDNEYTYGLYILKADGILEEFSKEEYYEQKQNLG